jgi:hypothetical protein
MRYADSRCEMIETYQPEHTYTFVGPCVVTGKEQRVTVKAQDLFRYRQGAYVQDAFPYLDKEEREFLISGPSGEGWKILFGKIGTHDWWPGVDETEE